MSNKKKKNKGKDRCACCTNILRKGETQICQGCASTWNR